VAKFKFEIEEQLQCVNCGSSFALCFNSEEISFPPSQCPFCGDVYSESESESEETDVHASEDRYTLVIGYIPEDWSGASDGSTNVSAYSAEESNTVSYDYQITDEYFFNNVTGVKIEGSIAKTYKSLSDESNSLADKRGRIPAKVIENLYSICLEENDGLHSSIVYHEQGTDHCSNARKKFNGHFYVYYVSESGGEISAEHFFVVKPQ
jgi:hypothetical protein